MQNVTINNRIRELIETSGARLVRVEAVSKTGEIKSFVFSNAARFSHISDVVTVAGARASASRAAHNPDLFNVWDINRKRWASFDLNRVLTVKADGIEHEFRLHRPRVYRAA